MASKIWVNILGVMDDPKQVYISANFCEKNRFLPLGGTERLISGLPGFRKSVLLFQWIE